MIQTTRQVIRRFFTVTHTQKHAKRNSVREAQLKEQVVYLKQVYDVWMSYLLKVGVVRGVCVVWKGTGLMTGLNSLPAVWGSDSENKETALCTVQNKHKVKLCIPQTGFPKHPSYILDLFYSHVHWLVPSYALAALTRLDHSRPQAVSGRGMSPGSSLLRGGTLSLPSVRDNSEADNGTENPTE